MGTELPNDILKEIQSQKLFSMACDIKRLPGDASNREYFRLSEPDKNVRSILMLLNAPEAFRSEEITQAGVQSAELDFVTIGRNWKKQGIQVPEILCVGKNYLLIEDFGEELLYDRRQQEDSLSYYELALEELVKIQKLTPSSLVKSRIYSPELLHWETEHFIEYALEKRNCRLSQAALVELREFFKKLIQKLSWSPYVVTHRDYHSKNLMLIGVEPKIGVIDFQDALMGPDTYDLASLLRDSYVQFSDEEENKLIEVYENLIGKKMNWQNYSLMSLQRNLKAVGRFFYISLVKKRDSHLPYVHPTMHRVYKSLDQVGEKSILSILRENFEND